MSANQSSALMNSVHIGASFVDETIGVEASQIKSKVASSTITSNEHSAASALTNGYAPAPFLIEPPVRVNCPADPYIPNNLASEREKSNRHIVKLLNYDAEISVAPSKLDSFRQICDKIEDIKENFLSVRENILSIEALHAQIKLTSADTKTDIEKISRLIDRAKELTASVDGNLETIARERQEMRLIERSADLKVGSMFGNILTCSRAAERFIAAVREDIGSTGDGAGSGKAEQYIAHLVKHNEAFEQQEKKFAEQKEEHQKYVDKHNQAYQGAKASIEAVGADTFDGLVAREMAVQFSDRFSQQAGDFKTESFVATQSVGSEDIRALFAKRFPEKYAELTGASEPKSETVVASEFSEGLTEDEGALSYEEPSLGDASDTAIFSETSPELKAESKGEEQSLVVAKSLTTEVSDRPNSELDKSREEISEVNKKLNQLLIVIEEKRSENWEKYHAAEGLEKAKYRGISAECGGTIRIIREQIAGNIVFLEQIDLDSLEAQKAILSSNELLKRYGENTDTDSEKLDPIDDIIEGLATNQEASREQSSEEKSSPPASLGEVGAISNSEASTEDTVSDQQAGDVTLHERKAWMKPKGEVLPRLGVKLPGGGTLVESTGEILDDEPFKLNGRTLPIRTISGLPENPEEAPTVDSLKDEEFPKVIEIEDLDTAQYRALSYGAPPWDREAQQKRQELSQKKRELLKKIENGKELLLEKESEKPTLWQRVFPKKFNERIAESIRGIKEKLKEFNQEVWVAVTQESTFMDRYASHIRTECAGQVFKVTADNRGQWTAPLLGAAIPTKYQERTITFDELAERVQKGCNSLEGIKVTKPVTYAGGSSEFSVELLDGKLQVTKTLQVVSSRYGKVHIFIDQRDGSGAHYKGDIWSAQGETAIKLFLRDTPDAFENRRPAIEDGEYYIPSVVDVKGYNKNPLLRVPPLSHT